MREDLGDYGRLVARSDGHRCPAAVRAMRDVDNEDALAPPHLKHRCSHFR